MQPKRLLAEIKNVVSPGVQQGKSTQRLRLTASRKASRRLDALNRIGNQVFALDLREPKNYSAISAPVAFPRIWDSSWFDWVQYNASIKQPMVRNAGEALGVRTLLNLTNSKRPLFLSDVQIKTVFEMEQMLAGKQPNAERGFNGLKSPKWPEDILGKIDTGLAAKGAASTRKSVRAAICRRSPAQNFGKTKIGCRRMPPVKAICMSSRST